MFYIKIFNIQIDSASSLPGVTPPVKQRKRSKAKQSTCDACHSIDPDSPGFISIDKESHISYISMQYPEEQELFSKLRHACVRSLSCEVYCIFYS